ncbi:hypothetical protein CR513_11568, partial [Mucuna pruriens]
MDEVLYLYGGFPNVPLMGTQGCINYNPSILLRQQGYPVIFPPTDESISPLLVHGLGIHQADILRKIRAAWGYPIKKGRELVPRNHEVSTAFRHWLQHRVDMVEIRFSKIKPSARELEETVQSEEEKIEEAHVGKQVADEEANRHKKNAKFLVRRIRMEEDAKFRMRDCLKAADAEMCLRREERNRVMAEKQRLLQMLKEAEHVENEHQHQIGKLQQQILQMKNELQCKQNKLKVEQNKNHQLESLAYNKIVALEAEISIWKKQSQHS